MPSALPRLFLIKHQLVVPRLASVVEPCAHDATSLDELPIVKRYVTFNIMIVLPQEECRRFPLDPRYDFPREHDLILPVGVGWAHRDVVIDDRDMVWPTRGIIAELPIDRAVALIVPDGMPW